MNVNLDALLNKPGAPFRYADELQVLCIYNNPEHEYFVVEGFALKSVKELREHLLWAEQREYPVTQHFGDDQEIEIDSFEHYLSHFKFKLLGSQMAHRLDELFGARLIGDFGYVLWLGEF